MDWRKKRKPMFRWMMAVLIIIGTHVTIPTFSQAENQPSQGWSNEQWEKAKEGLNYEEKLKEKKEREKSKPKQREESSSWDLRESLTNIFNSNLGKVLAIIIIVGLLAFALIKLLVDKRKSGDKKIIPASFSENFEQIEDNLPETDLERFLRLALERGDFKQAIRILFLTTIQKLDETRQIQWKKDKTNLDYLREMRSQKGYGGFRELTLAYEIIWYGDTSITPEVYHKLNPLFNNYNNQLISDSSAQ